MAKKVIAVAGATGAQGGGLAEAILADPNSEFSVRALTRNPDSDKAKELAGKGAEVVKADVDDPASIRAAFKGAYGAFCVTFYWEHFSPEKEMWHARTYAEAAKVAGLQHVIWSTLEDTRNWVPLNSDSMPTLMENYKVPHFDAKGESNKYFTESGIPVTLLNTSFYWDNMIYFGMEPKPGPDGKLAITFPMGDKKLPGISAADIGKCSYGIFKGGNEYTGKTVGIAGEFLTGSEMADILSGAMGQPVFYNEVDPETYRGFGFPGADDLGNMFQFKRDFNEDFCNGRDLTLSKKLNPHLQNFAMWLNENKSRIPLD
ncbi:MAG: nucleotide-diphosphate-sugar epimerase [Melioribacteraceae bacterium]|nr:MAG: nucleotide-diphosphate-sugar epimerase [Melioribacteraceae bacterium]